MQGCVHCSLFWIQELFVQSNLEFGVKDKNIVYVICTKSLWCKINCNHHYSPPRCAYKHLSNKLCKAWGSADLEISKDGATTSLTARKMMKCCCTEWEVSTTQCWILEGILVTAWYLRWPSMDVFSNDVIDRHLQDRISQQLTGQQSIPTEGRE